MKTLLTSAIVLALSTASGGGAAAGATAPALPNPCKLLTRAESQTLAGLKLQPAVKAGYSCQYTSYPTLPGVAQVFIYVESTFPNTIKVDRKLGHKFRKVPKLGDQALAEQGYIFVRKGKVWVTINLVAPELWSPVYDKRLEQAARIAISRIPKPKPKRAAAALAAKHPPAVGGRERWTGKERRYGDGITNYAGVTYQPNVVLIGGGASAVRGRSPEGLTWTIAGNAPGVSDLRVGKIMLATTFAAGRVLKVTRAGRNVKVVLGPAGLTDIFRDAVFDSPKPVRLAKPLVYQTTLPAKPKKRRAQAGATAFATSPVCCAGGIGVQIGYDNGSTGRLSASVRLYLEQPTVDFRLEIRGGNLIEAGFELKGVGGLRYDVRGATMDSSGNVKSGPLTVPGSLTIPLAGPLALTLTQSLQVSMQLGGRATLHAFGDYPIRGKIAFGYKSGGSQAEKISVSEAQPLQKNTLSLGVGVNAISLGWKVRATVGIGLAGFSAGVWYALAPGIAIVADGSHLMSLKFGCVTSALAVNQGFGVGFTMPEFVRSVVNAFLGAVGAAPVPEIIGKSWGPYLIVDADPVKYCPPRDEKGPSRALAAAKPDARKLVLQKSDFPPGASIRRRDGNATGYGVSWKYRTGSKPNELLSYAVVAPSVAIARKNYGFFKEDILKNEPKALPRYGDEQAVSLDLPSHPRLLVRKGKIVWLIDWTSPLGERDVTRAEAIAELKRYGAKQAKRVASG
jgi:hypothetical protein